MKIPQAQCKNDSFIMDKAISDKLVCNNLKNLRPSIFANYFMVFSIKAI